VLAIAFGSRRFVSTRFQLRFSLGDFVFGHTESGWGFVCVVVLIGNAKTWQLRRWFDGGECLKHVIGAFVVARESRGFLGCGFRSFFLLWRCVRFLVFRFAGFRDGLRFSSRFFRFDFGGGAIRRLGCPQQTREDIPIVWHVVSNATPTSESMEPIKNGSGCVS
jgi:hypothetical protein